MTKIDFPRDDRIILGLDVSTSITGYAIMHGDELVLGHIDLRKKDGLWKKADAIVDEFAVIQQSINVICVEESVQRYRAGKSSAHTISMLAKMNGLVSYLARERFGVDPIYLTANEARKSCGIRIDRSHGARAQKLQAFDWVTRELCMQWPTTRCGNVQQYCYDEADAYVIARAALNM